MREAKTSIVGTVGVPSKYGGFETLAENLVGYHDDNRLETELTVYCSAPAWDWHSETYRSARLKYIGWSANGPQSIIYDIISLFDASRNHTGVILMLGVSGAIALPFLRALCRSKVVTNIDGMEWRRDKWGLLAKTFLRLSEAAAVRWSHVVIADNEAIAEHVRHTYARDCQVLAYGGDHALKAVPVADYSIKLPDCYALALCRIEPENNAEMILNAFAEMPERDLVFVGNWNNSGYGRTMRERFRNNKNIILLDPIYDPSRLRWLRNGANIYVHGHSAGGTNPSLVEMMHFGIPILAHGCVFNRYTTENKARYFLSEEELIAALRERNRVQEEVVGANMREIANRRYTWDKIGKAYFDLMNGI